MTQDLYRRGRSWRYVTLMSHNTPHRGIVCTSAPTVSTPFDGRQLNPICCLHAAGMVSWGGIPRKRRQYTLHTCLHYSNTSGRLHLHPSHRQTKVLSSIYSPRLCSQLTFTPVFQDPFTVRLSKTQLTSGGHSLFHAPGNVPFASAITILSPKSHSLRLQVREHFAMAKRGLPQLASCSGPRADTSSESAVTAVREELASLGTRSRTTLVCASSRPC